MKSIFLILAIVIVANSANLEERDEESCNVSQGCQYEVERYKVCQERTSLARGLKQETGPCITCPDVQQLPIREVEGVVMGSVGFLRNAKRRLKMETARGRTGKII